MLACYNKIFVCYKQSGTFLDRAYAKSIPLISSSPSLMFIWDGLVKATIRRFSSLPIIARNADHSLINQRVSCPVDLNHNTSF